MQDLYFLFIRYGSSRYRVALGCCFAINSDYLVRSWVLVDLNQLKSHSLNRLLGACILSRHLY